MELTIDIQYEQIIDLIKQLPQNKITQLSNFLADKSIAHKKTASKNDDLQALLLKGPTMSNEQYDIFLQNRKMFNQWRVN